MDIIGRSPSSFPLTRLRVCRTLIMLVLRNSGVCAARFFLHAIIRVNKEAERGKGFHSASSRVNKRATSSFRSVHLSVGEILTQISRVSALSEQLSAAQFSGRMHRYLISRSLIRSSDLSAWADARERLA